MYHQISTLWIESCKFILLYNHYLLSPLRCLKHPTFLTTLFYYYVTTFHFFFFYFVSPQNDNGVLRLVIYGHAMCVNARDHIEKKPLYHVMPGSYTMSMASVGCNFGCEFCQNWDLRYSFTYQTALLIHYTTSSLFAIH